MHKGLVVSFIRTLTVGFGIAPNQRRSARGLYHRWRISLRPETDFFFIIIRNPTAFVNPFTRYFSTHYFSKMFFYFSTIC